MPSELGGHSADRARESKESSEHRLPTWKELSQEDREAIWARWDAECSGLRSTERTKSIAAAADRGIGREKWEECQRFGAEDSWQAGRIEQARYRLREGPPNYEGTRPVTDVEKQAFVEKYRSQENKALEHFRSEPVEGTVNKAVDPERIRRQVRCREGDPPIEPGDLTRRDDLVYHLSDRKGAGHPESGLGRPEAIPHPSHAAEERAAKIAEGRARAAEVVGKPNWSNAKYAGDVFQEKLPPELKERFPAGVPFSYEGFPMFDRYAVKTVRFDDGFVPLKPDGRPDRQGDNQRANAIFGWKKDPPGMTWHHVEDSRTMHLVDRTLHDWVRHWGGISIGKRHEEKNTDA